MRIQFLNNGQVPSTNEKNTKYNYANLTPWFDKSISMKFLQGGGRGWLGGRVESNVMFNYQKR